MPSLLTHPSTWHRALPAALLGLASGCRLASAQSLATPDASVPTTAPAVIATRLDPDGNDDLVTDHGTGPLWTEAHFERVGRPPRSLRRICDLTVHGDALYAAHANAPLGSDGATITRYQPQGAGSPFAVAFDWNRPGEPARGGGAGQGFLRVHTIGGRLFVPDADPPYAGFQLSGDGLEGYVFVSDAQGRFAPARGEHFHPPAAPDSAGRAGAAVLPRAYHVLDVIRYRGRMYASTGSVPPRERAWRGPSPGALHVANERWSRWTYEVDYPFPWRNGVWRLTYLVRFRDRLYAGIQDYHWREPNDYVWFAPPADAPAIRREDAHPVRVTDGGGAQTLRWYADEGRLYWITVERGGIGRLRVTEDGDHWRTIAMPREGGRPTDITRFRGALVVLTERRLYRLDGDTPFPIARIEEERSPFALDDIFCAAPMAVYRGELYAGGQRDGALYRLAEGPSPPPVANRPRRQRGR
jgi:hypothetical protein